MKSNGFLALVAVLLCALVFPMVGIALTPDSYAYQLLGKAMWSGEGMHQLALRDFYLPSDAGDASRSFPPLWPLVASLAGLNGAIVVNLLLSFAILWTIRHLANQWTTPTAWQYCTPALLLLHPAYLEEVASGRAIPITLFLILQALLCLSRSPEKRRHVCAGLLLGLATLARFDALPVLLVVSLAMLFTEGTWPQRFSRCGKVVLAAGITMAPWLARNMLTFGSLFVSDNALTAASIAPAIVPINWWPDGRIPTFADAPALWFQQRAHYLQANLSYRLAGGPGGLFSVAGLLLPILAWKTGNGVQRKAFLLGYAIVGAVTLSISLTPYPDARYWLLSSCLLWLMAALAISILYEQLIVLMDWRVAAVMLLIAMGFYQKSHIDVYREAISALREGTQKEAFQEAAKQFEPALAGKSVMRVGAASAEAFTYHTGKPSIYLPMNVPLYSETFFEWAKRFSVSHIVLQKDQIKNSQNFGVIVGEGGGMALLELHPSGAPR